METLDLRDSGPFTPEAAAKRVKLASQQLKWFTLCHPYWHTAHFNFEWQTAFPLQPLPRFKRVRIESVDGISGEFKLSNLGEGFVTAAVSAATKLAGIARFWLSIPGNVLRNDVGLQDLSLELNERGDWKVEAIINHQPPKGRKELIKSAIKIGHLEAAKDWKLEASEESVNDGIIETKLSLLIAHDQIRDWLSVLAAILSAQPKHLNKAKWYVRFEYDTWYSVDGNKNPQNWWPRRNKKWDRDWWKGGSWKKWKTKDGKSHGLTGTPAELFRLVNEVQFPSVKATVEMSCTVNRIDDLEDIFSLALLCESSINNPIGIFETDNGKQGFMFFDSTRKGIKLKIQYGPNGWEELHEALRRNNGKLVR